MMEINKATALLQQFNSTIRQWIDALDHYSLGMLQQRPMANAWSLGQVYIHLIEDTAFYLEQIKLALASNNLHAEKSMNTSGRNIFNNNGFPDMALENPFNDINLRQPESKEELLQGLTTIKNTINSLFDNLDLSTANGKTEHPGFAYFDAFEWLQFGEMHLRHHLRQKKNIDACLNPDFSTR